MSKKYFSRRQVIGLSGLTISSGCLNLQAESPPSEEATNSDSPTSTTTKATDQVDSTETDLQYTDLELSVEWERPVHDRGQGRHIYLTDEAVIMSGNGILAVSHSNGDELFHAFEDLTSNDTSSPFDPPFFHCRRPAICLWGRIG